ncbi:uncharacterized protein AC631_04390 [Debaryomyces fabryi]|uniref:Conserved oligomeric Golgi complex subunit 5 n=1 Tax=Debaryomyces fabryi TaxID=58627 RepID=A0A0V1PUR1_9ASCO|nr:uncharacterized protein AC631_04390 [Debaryomyces fabryi]KRZ99833.1 hypothetical protein AC631_04390 [Debaryomyces fabryi]CUM56599.1 unnamed protein product [Debaryomyces fabryi]
MTSATQNKTELEDFEAFLEAGFQPLQFANDLLLATNDKDGSELDGLTPLKKLQFDIDECDKRMAGIASSNYESLMSNFSQIEKTRSLVNEQINPLVDRVFNSFERIKSGVIQPYEEALKKNNALKRIHLTLNLLRGAGYFMFLVQQLEEIEMLNMNAENESGSKKDLIRLAKLHVQISQLYKSEKEQTNLNIKNSNANLLSIKLIRDYEAIQINKQNSLISEWSESISNDFNHHVSFSVNNIELQNKLIALYTLNEKEYLQIIEKTINKHAQVNLTQLSRSLQSPRNFNAIISEVKENSSDFLDKLESILSNCDISNVNNKYRTGNLLAEMICNKSITGVFDLYWPVLSYKFKKNIVATMARGGPIAKNLKIYSEGIKNSINENFKNTRECNLLIDAINVIEGSK